MIMDAEATYSEEQAVTAAAGSTHTIDHGAARDLGVGEELYVVVICTETMDDTGDNSTLVVALETDSSDTFTPDATRDLFTFAALSPAGTVKYARVGPDDINLRYSRLKYTPAGGDLSAGKFTAFLTTNIQKWKAYADGITIN